MDKMDLKQRLAGLLQRLAGEKQRLAGEKQRLAGVAYLITSDVFFSVALWQRSQPSMQSVCTALMLMRL
jgi:hypothetical protein